MNNQSLKDEIDNLITKILTEEDDSCQELLEYMVDEGLEHRDNRQDELVNDDGAAGIQ